MSLCVSLCLSVCVSAQVEDTEEASFEDLLSELKLEDERRDEAEPGGLPVSDSGGEVEHLTDTFFSFGRSQVPPPCLLRSRPLCLSVTVSLSLPPSLSRSLSLCPSLCLPASVALSLSVTVSLCLSLCLSLPLYHFVPLTLCPSLSLPPLLPFSLGSSGWEQWWWLSAEDRASPKQGWSAPSGETPQVVFEELVLHEMATLSNAKLAGCPSTLEPGEGYLCRLCSRRDAICKVMVMMQEIQTDHPFCYACLEKGNEMFSKALGGARSLSVSVSLSLSLCFSLSVSLSLTHTRAGGASLQYVPLDTINYGICSVHCMQILCIHILKYTTVRT